MLPFLCLCSTHHVTNVPQISEIYECALLLVLAADSLLLGKQSWLVAQVLHWRSCWVHTCSSLHLRTSIRIRVWEVQPPPRHSGGWLTIKLTTKATKISDQKACPFFGQRNWFLLFQCCSVCSVSAFFREPYMCSRSKTADCEFFYPCMLSVLPLN